jgi:dienelactone hydrolase
MQQLVKRFERHVTIQEAGDLDLDGLSLRPDEHCFASPNGELKGFLYLPPGDGPHPAIVLNHGSGVTQDSSDISKPSVASILLGWGVACFFPNRWGYGRSPGRYWTEDVSSPFGTADYDRQLVTRLHRESLDVVGAFDYLRTLAQIDAEHIGVMGSSFGGTVSLLAAAECERFRCAIDFAGAAMNWERTPKLREIMEKAASALEMPIFLIQAENDYSTKPTTDLARLLEGEGKTYQARVYPPFGVTHDEGHFFERAGAAVWGYDVKRFLERYL